MPRAASVVGALVIALAAAACFPERLVARNADALFGTPRAVPNKITHPVRDDARLAALWVGHATVLLQMDDRVILADPLFTETVGQITRRLVEVGLDPNDVPPVDLALVSHVHQDHLSTASLDLLAPKIGALVVPDGGLVYVANYRFPMRELATWESWPSAAASASRPSPCKHGGMRWGADDAWMHAATGYVLDYHGMRVYFGGDTAYDRAKFRETARRFPGIDLAFLPIAPGRPHAFMEHMHEDAAEALEACVDLGAKRMVPIHFDTFVNGEDAVGEPARVLRDVARARHLEDHVAVLEIGEQRVFVPR